MVTEPLDSHIVEKLRDHFPDKDWSGGGISVLRPVPAPSAYPSGSSEAVEVAEAAVLNRAKEVDDITPAAPLALMDITTSEMDKLDPLD